MVKMDRVMPSRLFWSVLTMPLPWFVRRPLLNQLCGYTISKSARIGVSVIASGKLIMDGRSSIGHFNVVKSLDLLRLSEGAKMGSFNWVTGISSVDPKHFADEKGRQPELVLGAHASITSHHFIDCCNRVTIGEFCTIAGAGTQIFTHAIDIVTNRQRSAPVEIGRYCVVGTGSVILKGSKLPDYSTLAANSTLHRAQEQTHTIYSGVPATIAAKIPEDALYFHRVTGFVK
jgi:acetyltransferase-like isoleucine patch superfamily enzyme